MKELSVDERKEIGAIANTLKNEVQNIIEEKGECQYGTGKAI